MDAAGSSSSPPAPLRIVIVPWLAFGHLLPYLELAERLASRGHRVSYVSTPRNLARLPLPLRSHVDLVALPLPRVDGLPDGAESTNDVPDDKRELHWKAFDGLAAPFAEFLAAACADEATRPHWVVADSFHHWAAAAAADHDVPLAVLLPTAAMVAAVPRPPPSPESAAYSFELQAAAAARAVPRYEREGMALVFANDGASSGMSTQQRCILTLQGCAVTAIRSCVQWEPESFPLVAPLLGKPVVPLGLLPPPPDGARRAAGTNREHATVRWLDAQPPGSVLYVALGSEVPLSADQVHELALGLELAGTRFLWALRKPSGAHAAAADDDVDMLPPGFRDRTDGHGLVTTGWVPQMSILAHTAVGGFLTHCGRNSLIESLLFGHPLVMLPIFGDQGPNARQMEAKKVGLQVARDDEDGSFDRHGVESAVRAVMLEGEARRGFVAGAARMQEVVADAERHERYIDELVEHLRSYNGASATTTDGSFTTAATSS
uniref:Uncharacterized protein n=1 Tax=Avena sativa TaxID=4498 RepID=A0ACD5XF03_AVESA